MDRMIRVDETDPVGGKGDDTDADDTVETSKHLGTARHGNSWNIGFKMSGSSLSWKWKSW